MDTFERVYYMRAITGVIAGIITGFLVPFDPAGINQGAAVGTAIGVAFVAFIISAIVGKKIARNVPKEKRRKVMTEGIIPFIFLLMVFMILVYTALHQSIVLS